MILKFVLLANDLTQIFDNVSNVIFHRKIEVATKDESKELGFAFKQRVDISLFDLKGCLERKDKIEFKRITFTDIRKDITVSVIFRCSCFICNDSGKTVEAIYF
jgi:hypothetical protein